MRINDLTREIIGAAMEVHRALGPGLLESVYEKCPCHELGRRPFLKLGGWNIGLLINFNVSVLKDGIRRIVLGLKE